MAYCLIGQEISGRDSFSVLSPVAEIAGMESVAATVLQKSTCLTKFKGALNLLSSASGNRPNPALAATEISTIRDENRRLRRQLARVVLLDAIDMDGAILPEGIEGDQISVIGHGILAGTYLAEYCDSLK